MSGLDFIKRYQLFEFCDQPWFNGVVREAFMDCLGIVYRVLGPYKQFFPNVLEVAERRGKVIDLASGNADPLVEFVKYLQNQKKSISVSASDLFPNISLWREIAKKYPAFSYKNHSASIFDKNENERCIYTSFSAFHHFKEDQVVDIIVSKVTPDSELFIFEMTPRNRLANYLWLIAGLVTHMFAPFFAQKWGWKKFFITTIIPIIPLIVVYDGLISNLRTYTKKELAELTRRAAEQSGKPICMEFLEKRYAFVMNSYCCRFYIAPSGDIKG